MDKFVYYLFRIFAFSLKLIPFWLLYLLADFVYFVLYKLVGYRKAVVYNNLKQSFPAKSQEELKLLEKKFYKHLSMIMLESIKGYSMSGDQIRSRYKVLNPEVADKYFDQGRNVIALAAHYGNWEWAIDAIAIFKHDLQMLYLPLTNKYIDAYLREKRSSDGSGLVPIEHTRFAFSKKRTKPAMFVMATDQNPANKERAIWIDFLNRDSAFVHGPEFYTKFLECPVVYLDFQRVKRGYYTVELIDLGDELWKEKNAVTKKYAQTLEKIILKKPENWLWSHRRWKHKREKLAETRPD